MNINPNLSQVASLVSEPSRAAILSILMDNRYHSASELAYMAKIKPQTASFHLAKMMDVEVITVEKQGRHRYFRIKNPEVAQIMESLLALSPKAEIRSLKHSSEDKAIRRARTCYDHLAGNLGVQLTDFFLKNNYLLDDSHEFVLTDAGAAFLSSLGMKLEEVRKKRRSFSPKCLDWSERKHHLAGALGHAVLELFLEKNWVQRLPHTRALEVTHAGKKALRENFSIEII